MSEHRYNILFICTGNSARSILAGAGEPHQDFHQPAPDKLDRLSLKRLLDEIGQVGAIQSAGAVPAT